MDLIEDIGPILGLVAFLGFAILALLIVLQAREVRRLREWAGRAPERAAEPDDANKATAEARGETEEEGPGRIAALRTRVAQTLGPRWGELDRRSPIDPRWFVGALLAGVIALGVVTSGFGLVGDDDATAPEETGRGGGQAQGREQPKEPKTTVTVLNATQIDDPVAPVSAVAGIADVVAAEVVEPADFKVVQRTNAPAGEAKTVIMFEPEAEDAAAELASAVEEGLGTTEAIPITPEIRAVAKGADLVLLVGQDDAEFGQAATDTVAP